MPPGDRVIAGHHCILTSNTDVDGAANQWESISRSVQLQDCCIVGNSHLTSCDYLLIIYK